MLELIVLVAVCFLAALGFWGATGWILLTLQTFDMDALFSILAGLLLGTVFLGISIWIARNSQLRELWKAEPPEAAPQPAQKQPS